MAHVDRNSESEFPVSKDKAFDAMCIAIPTINGMKIDTADKFMGRLVVKAGSLVSWGENVSIQLSELSENRTRVVITSASKTGDMFGGAHDLSKNRKNIERILSATSQVLQRGQTTKANYQTAQPQATNTYQQPLFNQPRSPAKKKMSLDRKIYTGIGALFLIALFLGRHIDDKKDGGSLSSSTTSSDNSSSSPEQATKSLTVVGQVLRTEYFDVTVNRVSIVDRVSTGNEFADLKAESGNKYLIINTTFKNTDKESRMIMDGTVHINYNGKDYEFDKSETIMLEGWGTMLDQINPLISKTTNLVYKIPAEIKGTALWNPGRSDKDQVITLGDIR